jgi:hypothetical protein
MGLKDIYEQLQQAADDDLQETMKDGKASSVAIARFKAGVNPFASNDSKAWDTEGAIQGGKALVDSVGDTGASAIQGTSYIGGALMPVAPVVKAGKAAWGALRGAKAAAPVSKADSLIKAAREGLNRLPNLEGEVINAKWTPASDLAKQKIIDIDSLDAAPNPTKEQWSQLKAFLNNTNLPASEKAALAKQGNLSDAVEKLTREKLAIEADRKAMELAKSRGFGTNAGAARNAPPPFDGGWRK